METRRGTAASPGIAIGPAFLIGGAGALLGRKFVMPDETAREIERFGKALARSLKDVESVERDLSRKLGREYKVADIFQVHIAILKDAKLREQVGTLIRNRLFTAEAATHEILQRYSKSLQESGDMYLLQRAVDFEDIEHRLLANLRGNGAATPHNIESPVVVVARNLTPSQTVAFDRTHVLGIATEAGGRTSHTAILARALGIPAVVGAQGLIEAVSAGETVIVDGGHGVIMVGPDDVTCARYRERERRYEVVEERTAAEVGALPAATTDGRRITIEANIEFPGEVAGVLDHGAEGVGLYRTEFLYHTTENPPDEETHFQAYAEAIRALRGKPMTIRVLDLGADKFPIGYAEKNPFLGCRSMRLLRLYPNIFRSQFRAILRASALGPVRFMFPMISSVDELREARKLVREVMAEFDAAGTAYDRQIKTGIMIEVPSAAIAADLLARECDFFSIGTNDLIQYALAVDRDNEHVAHLASPADPSILRLMRTALEAARSAGLDVSICGEMAGDTQYTLLLVGMGFTRLSMAPSVIVDVKKVIRSVSYEQARQVAEKAQSLSSAAEIEKLIAEETRKACPSLEDNG